HEGPCFARQCHRTALEIGPDAERAAAPALTLRAVAGHHDVGFALRRRGDAAARAPRHSPARNHQPPPAFLHIALTERFPPKWLPVRRKKTRQVKKTERD